MAAKKEMSVEDADRWIAEQARVRQLPIESMAGFRTMLVRFVEHLSNGSDTPHWTAKQVYIALGMFMSAAASLGIDTCPIEGFEPPPFDRVLGLEDSGYTSSVVVAAGYRSSTDKQASLPKVRYEKSQVIRYV